jgi:hypothetical protein
VTPAALHAVGATFNIEIQVPPDIAKVLTEAGQPVPQPRAGIGLVDTGATNSCVHESILADLGISPVGVRPAATAAGPVDQNLYPVRISFPGEGWTLDLTSAAGVDLSGFQVQTKPPQDLIALLGRDLLKNWVLIYNGPGGVWTVAM